MSDSHGSAYGLRRSIMAQPKAEVVIFLGDGEEVWPGSRTCSPRKCFWPCGATAIRGSQLPPSGEFTVDGVKIFYTHGNYYGVKSGRYNIISAARDRGAQVLLYGHTHEAFTDYEDGLYLMNPGSVEWVWRLLRHLGHHAPGHCDQYYKTALTSPCFELTG